MTNKIIKGDLNGKRYAGQGIWEDDPNYKPELLEPTSETEYGDWQLSDKRNGRYPLNVRNDTVVQVQNKDMSRAEAEKSEALPASDFLWVDAAYHRHRVEPEVKVSRSEVYLSRTSDGILYSGVCLVGSFCALEITLKETGNKRDWSVRELS